MQGATPLDLMPENNASEAERKDNKADRVVVALLQTYWLFRDLAKK